MYSKTKLKRVHTHHTHTTFFLVRSPLENSLRSNKYTTPWTIRYVIRYFLFNILRNHPAMHIDGLNIHALEGAIHIARSVSFVAAAAIHVLIKPINIFLTSPAICIVLQIRWSMPNAIHIAVYNIATMRASMHITPINMVVFNTFNTYCH